MVFYTNFMELRWPQPMNTPGRVTCEEVFQNGNVQFVTYFTAGTVSLLLPVQASGVGPVLREYEQVEVVVRSFLRFR